MRWLVLLVLLSCSAATVDPVTVCEDAPPTPPSPGHCAIADLQRTDDDHYIWYCIREAVNGRCEFIQQYYERGCGEWVLIRDQRGLEPCKPIWEIFEPPLRSLENEW